MGAHPDSEPAPPSPAVPAPAPARKRPDAPRAVRRDLRGVRSPRSAADGPDRSPPETPATTEPAPVVPVAAAPTPAPASPRPGSIDPAAIQSVVRSRVPEIERCYARGKMDDPELKGRVTVRIHIAGNGAVTSAEVEGSTVSQSGVESCIVEAVGSWKFPPPVGGQPAVISYPFNLH